VFKWAQVLGKARPLKFGRAKRLKIGAIADNYRLRSRISPELIHISNIGKVVDQLQPSHVGRRKVGELWSANKKVIGAHVDPPKWNFGAISDNFPL